MPAQEESLRQPKSECFVGRQRELNSFVEWLKAEGSQAQPLLVVGRGGTGKSTLLRRFGEVAQEQGLCVTLLDCRTFPCTPERFLQELGASDLEAAAESLNQTGTLLMLDTFEMAGSIYRFLGERLLPRLNPGVRVVLAGRFPPLLSQFGSLRAIPVPLVVALAPFSQQESQEYLYQRGVDDPGLVDQITAVAATSPLAISLAADMVLQLHIRDLSAAADWNLVVQVLVEQLLRDVGDERLRELLYAGAVVRQFDESSLAALTNQPKIGNAFRKLCRLSSVRASAHGLMLHDDIRRILLHDLRWRNPDQYETLRQRALAYYLRRLRSAAPPEREWLLAEIFYLREDGVIRSMAFRAEETGELWVEPGTPADHAEIRRLWHWSLQHVLAPEVGGVVGRAGEEPMLEAVLRYPGIRLRVVRNQERQALGFTNIVPVCRESLPFLVMWEAAASAVNAYIGRYGLESLPLTASESRVYFLAHFGYGDRLSQQVQATLLRDVLGIFSEGGIYMITPPMPIWVQFAESLGFERMPEAQILVNGPLHPVEGYILDLTRTGVEAWVEAITLGRRVPKSLTPADLERELKAVLTGWRNDELLRRSPLVDSRLMLGPVAEADRPEALRLAIGTALAEAIESMPLSAQEDLKAVEMAYLRQSGSHQHNAKRLNVSRATYYRMLDRGIRALTAAISRAPRKCTDI